MKNIYNDKKMSDSEMRAIGLDPTIECFLEWSKTPEGIKAMEERSRKIQKFLNGHHERTALDTIIELIKKKEVNEIKL
jgi:hypothetical protein